MLRRAELTDNTMRCDEGQPTTEGEVLAEAICGEREGHVNVKIKIV